MPTEQQPTENMGLLAASSAAATSTPKEPTGMNTLVQIPASKSAKYELVTGFISAVVGGLGVPFYIEATAKASWKDEASSIAANVLGIILFTKGSLDYLYDLIQKGEYAKATGIVLAAAVLYSPQVLIVIMESNASAGWTVFAAIATGLSGSFTSAYAVAKIPEMYQSAKSAVNATFCSKATAEEKAKKENILANLQAMLDRVRVSNYADIFQDTAYACFALEKLETEEMDALKELASKEKASLSEDEDEAKCLKKIKGIVCGNDEIQLLEKMSELENDAYKTQSFTSAEVWLLKAFLDKNDRKDLSEKLLNVSLTRQEILDYAMNLAKTAPQPCVENAGYLPVIAKGGLGVAFVGLLLFGTLYSYGCGTEASLREDFKAPPAMAFLAGLVLLSFQYLLNVTGGFGVASGVVDTLSLPNYKRALPNEKILGGVAGLALSFAAPVLGVLSASFSGRPTLEFSETCNTNSSVLKPTLSPINDGLTALMPYLPQDGREYGHVADYSSRFFNAIFAAMFFYWVQTFAVKRFGSNDDKNYLFIKEELESLIALVKKTPAEAVSQLFASDVVEAPAAQAPSATAAAALATPLNNDDEAERATIVSIAPDVVSLKDLRKDKKEFVSAFFSPQDVRDDASTGTGSTNSASSMGTVGGGKPAEEEDVTTAILAAPASSYGACDN